MRTRLTIAILLLGALAGCDGSNDRLKAVATLAASPTGGRSPASAQLVKLIAEGKVSYEQAIDAAWGRLETLAGDQSAAGASAAATEFAGAVLDAIAARQSLMNTGPQFEFFWMRVGGLAFKAAEEAHFRGRVLDARTLVLAGGDRWQNEAYWSRRPDHDALAAVVLAQTGAREEAIARLRSRAVLEEPAAGVLEQLTRPR